MRKTILLLCLLVAAGARANHYSDTYVIPIVGHVTGANGMVWMTDLTIRNFATEPLTVEMILIESGDNTANNIFPLITDEVNGSITVPANGTVVLRDLLEGYAMPNISGALILGGNRPFAVTSRAYNSRYPLGQTVPATRDFLTSSLGDADNAAYAYIPGVVSNATTRTNVGFVAGAAGSTSSAMVVDVSVRNAAGGIIGNRSFTIPAGQFAHHQFNISSMTSSQFDVGTVEMRVSQGEGSVVPYASIISNAGEAMYIMGSFPETTPQNNLLFRSLMRITSDIR
jgi:hypothetical protein